MATDLQLAAHAYVQLELDLHDGCNMELELSDRVINATVDSSDSCIICKGMLSQAEKVRRYNMSVRLAAES